MSWLERSDEALLEAWRGGQLAAFDALYARHEGPLYGFIRRQLDGDADAEDVLHQTFLGVLHEAKKRDVSRVRALLYEVARNACLNRLRSMRRGEAALEVERRTDVEGVASPELQLTVKQTALELQAALTRLPSALSEVYSLRAAGLSYDEVAKVLEVPVGTVKSRLHEVVSRLREELSR